MTLEVLKPGLLTTLQDAGRPGYAHLGIGRSGAFDAPALRIGDVEAPMWAPVFAPASTTLRLGAIRSGCRSYLAVRGGFDVAPVLGSRSVDINAGFGPLHGRPLRPGDRLPVGEGVSGSLFSGHPHRGGARGNEPGTLSTSNWRLDPRPWFRDEAPPRLRLLPGTHADALTPESRAALYAATFQVQSDSNRTGLRLLGPALAWKRPIEMVSEGCTPGLLQLPPSGQPIAFGPECPVSGGYPRIGQVAAVDIPRLAQLRPGDALRFMPCTFDEAWRVLREQDRALQNLESAIRGRLQHRGQHRST